MELLLAIVVAFAVIFFGALISMGNEQQRKAIDGLREQVVLWAVQDLKIKREHLAREVQVSNPLGWFNKVASKVCGFSLSLQLTEVFEDPQAIICTSEGSGDRIIFTLLSPTEIQALKRTRHNQLTQFANYNPLLLLPRSFTGFECSILNNGFLFDLELPLAWLALTGQNIEGKGVMWIYMLP
ncbi:MAG: hypothetical protein M1282_02090 [Chloroflexi bacterium]|nr:hypothetical protein [Chloroflexota bacterium]